MKYSTTLLSSIVYTMVINIQIETKEMKFSVSSMRGEEKVYSRLNGRSSSAEPPVEEELAIKERICQTILRHDFFGSHNVEWVSPHRREIQDLVKEDEPEVYETHYQRDSNYSLGLKFTNPYRLNYILTSEQSYIREWLFLCLTKNVRTKNIRVYFISRIYHSTDRKAVRFVFTYNDKVEIVLIAKAEGDSVMVDHKHVQHHQTTKWREADEYFKDNIDITYNSDEENNVEVAPDHDKKYQNLPEDDDEEYP